MEESRSSHAVLITKYLRHTKGGALRRDDARNLLRRTLECYARKHRLELLAWGFLPSKMMLVVALPTRVPLQTILGELCGYYTRRFNARYGKEGPLFRTRFLKQIAVGPVEIREVIDQVHDAVREESMRMRPGAEPFSSIEAYAGRPDTLTTLWRPPIPTIAPASVAPRAAAAE